MASQCQTPPPLCANACGFYGSAATKNLCSRCYAQHLKDRNDPETASADHKKAVVIDASASRSTALREASSAAGVSSSSSPVPERARNRCGKCNKKTGPVAGFSCRCGLTFCGAHRYPEEHGCDFDFKTAGRAAVAKSNPLVKADKLAGRI